LEIRMTRTALGLVLGSTLMLFSACGDYKEAPEPDKTPATPSVARGGQLYDKFWKVSDAAEPQASHPLWATRPDPTSNQRTGSTTWRCKECHGWDYKGAGGAYAKGSHKTGFLGVFGSKASEDEMMASLVEAHGYRAAGLTETDLKSLVLFLRKGLVDTATWIDDTGAFAGDATRGKARYMLGLGGNKACKKCHGGNGLKPPKGAPADFASFVGAVANKNPSEFLHKVRFGHPPSLMPAAVRGTATMQDIADLAAFARTLPQSK
jgi:mono/diheme cytochrome c family protein